MFVFIKDVLEDLNEKLKTVNQELGQAMSAHVNTVNNQQQQQQQTTQQKLMNATANATLASTIQIQWVGAYRLEKTLGKGQTGLVKTGTHCITGKKVAVKIVNKEKLNESVLQKVEREIAIMKLIEHPHILQLYDVYENKKYLYLLLEHVSGGELFDYLVRKGRLMAKEARKFFRQIISALDFCHAHNICHRDLKPENLLLDDRNNIKVADFGMASLQVEGSMLETSCGSPHYACPEVIRGEKYDGRKADVWSCGVILYALLVGALPFDDDNLRNLLEKVKKGVFHIPHFVPTDCQSLLRAMVEVDPNKRISLQDVFKHPWVIGPNKGELELEVPMAQVVETHIIPNEDSVDPDVLRHMNNLGCFKDKEKLINELLSPKHNTEKIVYFLLLDRKRRRPAKDDDTESVLRSSTTLNCMDPPKKRIDVSKPRLPPSRIAEGSPMNPRKNRYRIRQSSLGGSPDNGSPQMTPRSFYSARSSNNAGRQAAETLALLAMEQQQSANKPQHRGSSIREASTTSRANNYHYFTQPINPTVVQRASRKDEHNLQQKKTSTTTTANGSIVQQQQNNNVKQVPTAVASAGCSSNSLASSNSSAMDASTNSIGSQANNHSGIQYSSGGPWRSKISNTIKNSILGTPRFHRKFSTGNNNNNNSGGGGTGGGAWKVNSNGPAGLGGGGIAAGGESDSEYGGADSTTDLVKKSFFGSLSMSGADRDDVQCIPVQNKTLAEIKAELIRMFLTIHELNHSVIGQNSFKVDYKRSPYIGFSRGVKFQADIVIPASQQQHPHENTKSDSATADFFVVQFTLHSGPIRRFKRLIEHFTSILQSSQRNDPRAAQQKPVFLVRPRKLSSQSSVGSTESASAGATNERSQPPPLEQQQEQQQQQQQLGSVVQQKQSVTAQNSSPMSYVALAEDESGFFACDSTGANSSSNSKTVLRPVHSCSIVAGSRITSPSVSVVPWRSLSSQQQKLPMSIEQQQHYFGSTPPTQPSTQPAVLIAANELPPLIPVPVPIIPAMPSLGIQREIRRHKESTASWGGSPSTAAGMGATAVDEFLALSRRPETAMFAEHKASVFSWSSQCSEAASSVDSCSRHKDSVFSCCSVASSSNSAANAADQHQGSKRNSLAGDGLLLAIPLPLHPNPPPTIPKRQGIIEGGQLQLGRPFGSRAAETGGEMETNSSESSQKKQFTGLHVEYQSEEKVTAIAPPLLRTMPADIKMLSSPSDSNPN